MIDCLHCSSVPPLCAGCVAARFDQLKGVAACRGYVWATAVAARVSPRAPWPSWEGSTRVRFLAASKCEDLARDLVLLELLARACHAEAARTWGELASQLEPGHASA